MWWLRNSIICLELVETEKPRIEVSPSLFARDCKYIKRLRFFDAQSHDYSRQRNPRDWQTTRLVGFLEICIHDPLYFQVPSTYTLGWPRLSF